MSISTLLNPSLSISLQLDPPFYKIGAPGIPTLSIKVQLTAQQPIAVFTYKTILNPASALRQNSFEIIDRETNNLVPQVTKKFKRTAIKRQLGQPDERYFLALVPGEPQVITGPFGPSLGEKQDCQTASTDGKVFGVRGLERGQYTLRALRAEGAKGCEIGWWRWGMPEQNLEPATVVDGVAISDTSLNKSEEPSPLVVDPTGIAEVVFEVR